MEKHSLQNEKEFIEIYFQQYGNRESIIKNYIADDFTGLDGITKNIYHKETWLQAIDSDFQQVDKKFKIEIIDFRSQPIENDLISAVCTSFWDINIFDDFLEFECIRTVFLLRRAADSFQIVHLSNSIALNVIDPKEVYPFTLRKVLRSWKNSLFQLHKR